MSSLNHLGFICSYLELPCILDQFFSHYFLSSWLNLIGNWRQNEQSEHFLFSGRAIMSNEGHLCLSSPMLWSSGACRKGQPWQQEPARCSSHHTLLPIKNDAGLLAGVTAMEGGVMQYHCQAEVSVESSSWVQLSRTMETDLEAIEQCKEFPFRILTKKMKKYSNPVKRRGLIQPVLEDILRLIFPSMRHMTWNYWKNI